MVIYIGLLVGAFVLGVLMCKNNRGSAIYCSIMGLALFLVAALRRSVGNDYNNYGWLYIFSKEYTLEEIAVQRTEKGYFMITKILADYIPEYQAIFIVCAAFFAAATAVCVYKYCKKPYLGFCFFLVFGVYFNSLNFLRQMIAGFIVLYALKYVQKNQFFRYLIIVLLASCFHFSAFIMIPFYFILKIKMTPITLGTYSVLTVLMLIFSWDIIEFLGGLIHRGYDSRANVHVAVGVTPTYAIFFGLFFILAFIFRKRLVERNPANNIVLNCMFFTFFFELIGVKHSIVSRFGVYFIIPATLILMPEVIEVIIERCKKIKGNKKKRTTYTAVVLASVAAVCLGMYGMMFAENYNGVLPYRTMFDDFSTEAGK